ncbi:MAG: hypothetical protein QOE92_1178 [Chloroflexota bacterium]|nr:hypothetical protein [Chloroflexota bacterium]
MPDKEQPGGETPEKQEGSAAGERAADPERLMSGEDPDTPYLEDATHWLGVYGELIDFKHELIGVTKERIVHLTASAREELTGTDLVLLNAELERLKKRRDFWQGKTQELS